MIVPLGIWLCLIRINDSHKSLSNVAIELPSLSGLAACVPILLRVAVARFRWRTDLVYFAGWLISVYLCW